MKKANVKEYTATGVLSASLLPKHTHRYMMHFTKNEGSTYRQGKPKTSLIDKHETLAKNGML